MFPTVDGTGYVEDGRDLFDDEQDDYEGCTPKSKSKGSPQLCNEL